MGAELAMITSVKTGINQLGAALRPASVVMAETADYAIGKNEQVGVNAEGKIVPFNVLNGASELSVGTDDSVNCNSSPTPAILGNGYWMAITGDAEAVVKMFKYNSETKLAEVISTIDLSTVCATTNYAYFKKLKDGVVALFYAQASDTQKVALITYDSDYALTAVTKSNDITTNSYSQMSTVMQLDETRIAVFSWNSHTMLNVFELSEDNTSFVTQSVDQSTNTSWDKINYANVVDWGMTGAKETFVAYNSNSGKLKLNDTSGTDVTLTKFTDDTFDKYSLSIGQFGLQHYPIPFDAETKETLAWCFGNNSVSIPEENTLLKFTSDSDGNFITTSYKAKNGWSFSSGGNSPKMVKFNATTWYMYAPYTQGANYLHNVYKIVLNDADSTFILEQIFWAEYEDTTTSHAQKSSVILFDDNQTKSNLITSCFNMSKHNETTITPLNGVDGKVISAITVTDIDANSTGEIFTEDTGIPVQTAAGTPFALSYTTLSTGYAVKNK